MDEFFYCHLKSDSKSQGQRGQAAPKPPSLGVKFRRNFWGGLGRSVFGLSTMLSFTACGPLKTAASLQEQTASSTTVSPVSVATPVPVAVAPTPVPTPAPGRPSSAANLEVCPAASPVQGLDVSDYDPSTNWTTVQHAGAGFTFVKATEGTTFTNSYFASDWKNSALNGVFRGAYHFFHASENATAQAQFFLQSLNAAGGMDADALPAMLDWEVSDGESASVQIEQALIWLQAVEAATGKIPVIYTDTSFWNDLGNPAGFQRYPLFIADYGVSCPETPAPWSNWTFWQKGTGPFSGVTASSADLDVFNGDLAQLAKFIQVGSTALFNDP